MKKGKRQVLAFALSLIVILTDAGLMEMRASAHELEQEMVCGESGEEDADTLSENDAGQGELEEDGSDTEEKEGLEEETGESGAEDSGIGEELPSEDTDDSMQEEEPAVVSEESVSVSGNETEQLVLSAEKSGENIASGQYKNEEDGSDITWIIDANGKLTVSGTGNFGPDVDIPPDNISNWGWYPWLVYDNKIKSAEIRVTGTTNATHLFWGCSNLNNVDLSAFDTSKVTDMSAMFANCSNLNVLDVTNLDTSKVVNMSGMFTHCNNLNVIDVSRLDTSNVTNMSGMFDGCESLKSINLSSFDTSNVTDMLGMFRGCSSLEKIDVSGFDTSRVTDMTVMFAECEALKELDLSAFHVENVISMYEMFRQCTQLKKVQIGTFHTKKLCVIEGMFMDCKNLTSLDLSGFDFSTLEGSGNADGVFKNCDALMAIDTPYNTKTKIMLPVMEGYFWCDPDGTVITELPQNQDKSIKITQTILDSGKEIASGEYKENGSSLRWRLDAAGKLTVEGAGEFAGNYGIYRAPWYDKKGYIKSAEIHVNNMKNASYMFNGCSKLANIDVSSFDTSQVTNMAGMFRGCESFTDIDLSSFDTSNVTDMSDMFSMLTYEIINVSYVGPESINMSSFKTGKVTDMSGMFLGCGNLKNLDLSSFDTRNVRNMNHMFASCGSLTELDVNGFHTENVTDMSYMFSTCNALKNLDLSHFDTGRVTDMNGMFSGCDTLESLDVSIFNTANVENMSGMFDDLKLLTSLDVSSFDTSKVKDMSWMFNNCKNLTSLDVSGFDTDRVTNMSLMFFDCGQDQIQLDVSHFNTSHVTDMSGMFQSSGAAHLDVSQFDTGNVVYMSSMFASNSLMSVDVSGMNTTKVKDMSNLFLGCRKLKELDLSSFDVANATRMTGMFEGCLALNKMETPKNLRQFVGLPVSETGDEWHDDAGKTYTELPMNLDYSVTLRRKGNSEGGDTTRKNVYISGIKIANKVYDGSPNSYTGTAVVLDTSGNQIEGVSLTHTYSGTLSDGSVYAETEEAPSQAGSYTLTFKISGDGAAGYNLNRAAYSFDIIRKAVTITAESVEIEIGERLPETADLKYTIDGLIENDTLPQNPSLKYSVEHITTEREGKYEIIPYGANEGNNYRIKYVNGILLVGNYGEIPVEDIPNGGIIPEGLWVAGIAEDGYDYTGKAVRPQVRVYDYKTPLREKKDYTIAYARNTKAYSYASSDKEYDAKKAPTITVTAKGNYSGKETVSFKIRPLDIGGEGFSADNMAVAYKKNGVQKPIPALSWNGKKLKNKADYTVAYYDSQDNELDAVKEVGEYYIVLTGRGNFSGSLGINLTVTDRLKLMNKVSVAGIKGQPYTGDAIMPVLTVKDGRKTLTEDVHYAVSYRHNTEVGTAYAVVTGIAEAGYCGTKRVSFKITGTPIKNASVTGLAGQKFVYEGVDMTPQLQLGIRSNKDEAVKPLVMGTDYTVTWQKNRNAGTATVIFTGKGAYTGNLKKTFKIGKFDIAANADSRFVAALEQETIPYAKGGAKPKVSVKFKNSDGSWQILTEGQDYTLSYRNHTAVNDGSRADKQPTVIVKGKGNFSGIYGAVLNYRINPQELGQLSITAQDKTYQNRKNIYATKVTVTDLNGKILRAGTDYEKAFIYTYEDETVVTDTADDRAVTRAAGELVGKNDMIPAGTKLNVRIETKAGSNYTGSLVGEYRITQAAISTASVSIPKQTYTGQPIILDKSQITVRIKGTVVKEDQYEIVQSSYKNNVKKGNASVTIRGVGNYGGTKTVKFAIKAKGFVWWK